MAGHLDSGLGYIVPAYQIFEDMQNQIGKLLALVQRPFPQLSIARNNLEMTSNLEGLEEFRNDWKLDKKEVDTATNIGPANKSNRTDQQMHSKIFQKAQYSARSLEIHTGQKSHEPPSVPDEYKDDGRPVGKSFFPPPMEQQSRILNISDELTAHLTHRIKEESGFEPRPSKPCKFSNLES